MASRYVRTTGGNWGTASTWASTNGGTDSVSVPTTGDTAIATSISGNLTVNTGATCSNMTLTGYTRTLTINSGQTLTAGAAGFNFLIPSGCTPAGTGNFVAPYNTTISSGGLTVPWNVSLGSTARNVEITLSADFSTSGNVTVGANTGNMQYQNGSFALKCGGNFTHAGKWQTNSGSPTIVLTGTGEAKSTAAIGANSYITVPITINTAGTITFPSDLNLHAAPTYTAGTLDCTAGTIALTENVTIANTFPDTAVFSIAVTGKTLTFSGACDIGGIRVKENCAGTVSGNYSHTLGKLQVDQSGILTYVAGYTLTVTNSIYISGVKDKTTSIMSSSAGNEIGITYTGDLANQAIAYATFTDVDASGGNTIYNFWGKTLTNTLGVTNVDTSDIGVSVENVYGIIM